MGFSLQSLLLSHMTVLSFQFLLFLAVSLSPSWSEAIPIATRTGIDGYRFAPPILRRRTFAISRRIAPEVCISFAPSKTEGAGKTGCALHPRSRVQLRTENTHTSIQVQRKHPAFPAQWLYGLLRALPGERLFCHRRSPRSLLLSELDASTAASGPHDFAVRFMRARLRTHPRPPHPTARS